MNSAQYKHNIYGRVTHLTIRNNNLHYDVHTSNYDHREYINNDIIKFNIFNFDNTIKHNIKINMRANNIGMRAQHSWIIDNARAHTHVNIKRFVYDFDRLVHIKITKCSINPAILPRNLRELELRRCIIYDRKLKNFPDKITKLIIRHSNINEIVRVPPDVHTLLLKNSKVDTIKNLNKALRILNLSNNKLVVVENLPDDLKIFTAQNNKIRKLSINSKLKELYLSRNELTEFEVKSDELVYTNLSWNKLTNIKAFPATLIRLNISYNVKLESIEQLPPKLEVFIANNCHNLSYTEHYPHSLYRININATGISEIRNWPHNLRRLRMKNSKVKSLANIIVPPPKHPISVTANICMCIEMQKLQKKYENVKVKY